MTPHFSSQEFACRDGAPYPLEWIQDRLRPLCEILEQVRAACGGQPVSVLSGYRTQTYNQTIGAAPRSQHVEGRAADVAILYSAPESVHAAALALHRGGQVQLGGLGLYPTFVHLDVRPGERLARWRGSRTRT